MAIKVVFPTGKESVTAQGLFQWDYGQVLEIECAELGFEILEVHFACPNMTVAIPRPCTFTNGVGTVPVPDQCLEQENPITAWICRIDDTQSQTIKTVVLPITKKTKPIRTHEVPAEHIDKYAELITEVNETVEALKSGNITVAKAVEAQTANRANAAKIAENASYAISAGIAERARFATSAGKISMSLAGSVVITSGSGTCPVEGDGGTASPILNYDTAYFVLYESSVSGVSSSALVYKNGGIAFYAPINKEQGIYISLGSIASSIIYIYDKYSRTDTDESGTVYFYKLGSINSGGNINE